MQLLPHCAPPFVSASPNRLPLSSARELRHRIAGRRLFEFLEADEPRHDFIDARVYHGLGAQVFFSYRSPRVNFWSKAASASGNCLTCSSNGSKLLLASSMLAHSSGVNFSTSSNGKSFANFFPNRSTFATAFATEASSALDEGRPRPAPSRRKSSANGCPRLFFRRDDFISERIARHGRGVQAPHCTFPNGQEGDVEHALFFAGPTREKFILNAARNSQNSRGRPAAQKQVLRVQTVNKADFWCFFIGHW